VCLPVEFSFASPHGKRMSSGICMILDAEPLEFARMLGLALDSHTRRKRNFEHWMAGCPGGRGGYICGKSPRGLHDRRDGCGMPGCAGPREFQPLDHDPGLCQGRPREADDMVFVDFR
jgi:hypothetical protein